MLVSQEMVQLMLSSEDTGRMQARALHLQQHMHDKWGIGGPHPLVTRRAALLHPSSCDIERLFSVVECRISTPGIELTDYIQCHVMQAYRVDVDGAGEMSLFLRVFRRYLGLWPKDSGREYSKPFGL